MGGTGGRGIKQDYFVENVLEELDAQEEYYFDRQTSRLILIRNSSSPPEAGSLVAALTPTLVQMAGSAKSAPVHDVEWVGVTFRDTRPTFMAPHEATSGGDWAVHRGKFGAVCSRVLRQRCRSCGDARECTASEF